MQIDVSPIVETLDVNIGDKTITLKVDISEDGKKRIAASFLPIADRIRMQEQLRDKAIASGNAKGADAARQKIADAIESAFVASVGKASYDELIDAITDGDPSRRADCTTALTHVMHGISDVLKTDNERNDELASEVASEEELKKTSDAMSRVEAAREEYMAAMRDLQEEDVAHPVIIDPFA